MDSTNFTVHKPSADVLSVMYHGHVYCGTSNLGKKTIVKFT